MIYINNIARKQFNLNRGLFVEINGEEWDKLSELSTEIVIRDKETYLVGRCDQVEKLYK